MLLFAPVIASKSPYGRTVYRTVVETLLFYRVRAFFADIMLFDFRLLDVCFFTFCTCFICYGVKLISRDLVLEFKLHRWISYKSTIVEAGMFTTIL